MILKTAMRMNKKMPSHQERNDVPKRTVGQARATRWGAAILVDPTRRFITMPPFTRGRRPTASLDCLSQPTKRATPQLLLAMFIIACPFAAPIAAQEAQTETDVQSLLKLYELSPETSRPGTRRSPGSGGRGGAGRVASTF